MNLRISTAVIENQLSNQLGASSVNKPRPTPLPPLPKKRLTLMGFRAASIPATRCTAPANEDNLNRSL